MLLLLVILYHFKIWAGISGQAVVIRQPNFGVKSVEISKLHICTLVVVQATHKLSYRDGDEILLDMLVPTYSGYT